MAAGPNHFIGETNLGYSNITGGHFSGDFTDPNATVTGCSGNNYPSPNMNIRERSMVGGQVYGIASDQPNPGNHIPYYTTHKEGGFSSPDNLNASKQYGPDTPLPKILDTPLIGGRGRRKHAIKKSYKGGSNSYYELDVQGDTRTYAGSGYPPIVAKSQNLTGGKRIKHKSRRLRKHSKHIVKSRRHSHSRYCKHNRKSRRHQSKKHKIGLRKKMSSKLFKKLIGGRKGKMYGGNYAQFMGNQPFSQGYGISSVTPSTSALANPIPFTPYNHCSDNNK